MQVRCHRHAVACNIGKCESCSLGTSNLSVPTAQQRQELQYYRRTFWPLCLECIALLFAMLSLAAEDPVLNLLDLWQPNYFGSAQFYGNRGIALSWPRLIDPRLMPDCLVRLKVGSRAVYIASRTYRFTARIPRAFQVVQ